MLSQKRVLALAVIIFSCWAAYGCASTEAQPAESPNPETHLKILDYKCHNGAVSAMAIKVDGPGSAVIGWDNEKACGTPA